MDRDGRNYADSNCYDTENDESGSSYETYTRSCPFPTIDEHNRVILTSSTVDYVSLLFLYYDYCCYYYSYTNRKKK